MLYFNVPKPGRKNIPLCDAGSDHKNLWCSYQDLFTILTRWSLSRCVSSMNLRLHLFFVRFDHISSMLPISSFCIYGFFELVPSFLDL